MSIKYLGRQSLIYGTGYVLTRSVTFLLLPLYTNVFSLEDYGVISLIYTFLGFMNIILHYGLDASLLKYYVPSKSEDRKSILTNAYTSLMLTTIVVIIIMILLKNQVSELFFGINQPQITLLVSGILFFDVLWTIHVLLLRAENKPLLFIGINFFNVFSSLGLNIFFIMHLQLGIYGVLISNLITSGCIFLATLPLILHRFSINTISREQWKKLMSFAYPFLFSGIFSMIIELSDRYILLYITNIETVGLYNSGYKLGMIMMLVVVGFNMAWQPYFLRKDPKDNNYIAKITTVVISILVFIWILLLLWVENIVKVQFWKFTFFGEQFWASTSIVPIIALAFIFHALYLLQLPGVYLLEKSGWIAFARGIGATLNISLNFLLIPIYGIMGAAVATCISYLLIAIIFYMINKKIFPISYNWVKLGIISLTAGFIIIIHFNFQLNISMKIIASIFYPVVMVLSGVLKLNRFSSLIST